MIIDCKTVILRAIELSDMEFLQDIMNDPAIERMSGDSHNFPISKDRQRRWFDNFEQQKELRCIIQIKDGPIIGIITLIKIDWKNRTGSTGIKIKAKPEDRRPNDVYDAVMGFRNYCFNELNLNCLYGTVLEYNHLSRKLGKKCGSVEEGILRQRVFKNGKYHNLIATSILAKDFNPLYKKYLEER
jgi:RimJ/RimL family protein N-acetyltransferase